MMYEGTGMLMHGFPCVRWNTLRIFKHFTASQVNYFTHPPTVCPSLPPVAEQTDLHEGGGGVEHQTPSNPRQDRGPTEANKRKVHMLRLATYGFIHLAAVMAQSWI